MTERLWTPEVFVDEDGSAPFSRFLDSLPRHAVLALQAAIRTVLAARGISLVETEWLKALGSGLHEFRVRHTADEILRAFGDEADRKRLQSMPGSSSEPVLLRVFVHFHGNKVILLLSGYDKGDDSSRKRQDRAIATARRLLATWKREQARIRAADRRRGAGSHK